MLADHRWICLLSINTELLQKIKALREARLRAEHVAFSFMKRRVQPRMARDTLGYQYTGNEDTSRMPDNKVNDEDIVKRLGRVFKVYATIHSLPSPRVLRSSSTEQGT
jgi:hypothetical protein